MDLYDVLDQIVDLLRQRKRLTYRLLKRQFALDDETLEDLKDELIKGAATLTPPLCWRHMAVYRPPPRRPRCNRFGTWRFPRASIL